ncbi:MAG: hypothetical protein ACFFAO_07490 [Candidatus Hermodarchaeota archaeon]
MSNKWNIGSEARKLDEKSIKERMKIEGRSVKKIFIALLIYACVLTIFLTVL